jgi:Tfp pilus assembly protein PilF
MKGRPLSLSLEVQAALTRGHHEAARKLIDDAIAIDKDDAWDIEVATELFNSHGGCNEARES